MILALPDFDMRKMTYFTFTLCFVFLLIIGTISSMNLISAFKSISSQEDYEIDETEPAPASLQAAEFDSKNASRNSATPDTQSSHAYTVTIHAIKVADNDGTNKAKITNSEIQTWVENANKIYASAGIRLILERVPAGFLNDSDVNRMFNYLYLG
jgi:hypothetical protein